MDREENDERTISSRSDVEEYLDNASNRQEKTACAFLSGLRKRRFTHGKVLSFRFMLSGLYAGLPIFHGSA